MNEGFKALPEYVQRKIDPEMAKKFAMGGGVMQRPLFRQMGGPAQPMPQDMMQAQPDPQAMVQEAEMAGERVGEQIAAQTMTNIDSATDVKGAIDALRGNAAPLEERYQELAGFVGERDAMQTPESVLALTQPAIMMTEQGAMDSGIGELMQTVAGDSEMSGGMDQGVGALMMQGAGNTPPENFRQGGPVMVQRFANGMEVSSTGGTQLTSIDPYLTRATAARENIFGSPEERAARLQRAQQQAKSDALFNLANFGLAFAGETEGGSVAERLANAATRSNVVGGFQQAGRDVAAARDLQDQQDMQMRLSALESAEKSLAAAEETASKFGLEQLRIEAENKRQDKNLQAQIDAATTAFDRQTLRDKHIQNYEERITNLRLAASSAEALKDRNLQERLANESNSLQRDLVTLRADANLANDIAKINLTNSYDLEKIQNAQDFEMTKLQTMQGYEQIAADKQRSFTAAQNALNRMLTRGENAKNRTFQEQQDAFNAELQTELKRMGLKDNEIARAQQQAQFLISSAQKDHQLLNADEQLKLNGLKIRLDAAYDAEKIALEKEAAKTVLLGSKSKTDQIRFITNAERLKAFANKTLGDNTPEFKLAVSDYMRPTQSWDSETGRYVSQAAPNLPREVKEAIKTGDPEFYNDLFGGNGKADPSVGGGSGSDSGAGGVAEVETGPINLAQEASKIMTDEGKVDMTSPLFERADTTLFKPNVDYTMAIGASGILPGLGKAVSEFGAEVGIGEGTGPIGQNLGQAQKDLTTLANRLFSITVDKSQDDRVLKQVQERLEKEVEGIRPGGLGFAKNDADARASLNSLASTLALLIERQATKVDEFGGESDKYKVEQVTRARDDIIASFLMLNEVLAFRDHFDLKKTGSLNRPSTDEGVSSALEFLNTNPTNQEDTRPPAAKNIPLSEWNLMTETEKAPFLK